MSFLLFTTRVAILLNSMNARLAAYEDLLSPCNTRPLTPTMYVDINGMESTLPDAFNRDGYVTGIKIFEHDSAEMMHYVEELNKLQSTVENGRFVGQEINPHLAYEFLWDIATHPRIVSIIQEILSEDFALLATTLFTKYPKETNTEEYKYVGYHQDVRYWGLDPPNALNIFFAFDNITDDKGPMLYIPKSHKNGIYEHKVLNNPNNLLIGKQEIPQDLFDVEAAVPVILPRGSIAIHHGSLVHGSGPNMSRQRRCGFVLRIMDLKTRITVKEEKAQSQALDFRQHPHYTKHNYEWRKPRVICGDPTINIHQFYPHPSCFIQNPEIPKPVQSNSCRYFVPSPCEQEQCDQM
eukprot:133567_1